MSSPPLPTFPQPQTVSLPLAGNALSTYGDMAMEPILRPINAWWMRVGPTPHSRRLLVQWEERHASVDTNGVVGGTPVAMELIQITARSAVSMSEALPSESFGQGQNLGKFQVLIDHRVGKVRFGPVGNLGMLHPDVSSRGLGSYALSYLARWLQCHCPRYRFERPSLSPVDAEDPDNRTRRNQLYTRIGLLDHACHMAQDLRPDLIRLTRATPERKEVVGFLRYIRALSRDHKVLRNTKTWRKEESERRCRAEVTLAKMRLACVLAIITVIAGGYALHAAGILSMHWRWL